MENQEIFQLLINVGKSIEDSSEPPQLLINALRPHSRINLLGRDKVINEVISFANAELISLLKGLTYVERELKWPGGSVAASKPIFDVLCTRDMDVEQVIEAADWITNNTSNFFNQVRRVQESELRGYYDSDSEHQKAIKRKKEVLTRARRQEEEQRRLSEKEAQTQWVTRKASKAAGHRDRSTPVRAELISKFDDMPIRDQLVAIAEDDVHAPNFYPTKCASSANLGVIESLSSEIKEKLAQKLKGRHRGPWGGFKKRLLSVIESKNDHGPV